MAIVDAAIAVGGAVGLEGTAAAIGGGALIGAGTGALYSGITGDGNVLNSALNGALIGGAGMGIGSALGLTGASGTLFGPAQTGLFSSAAPAAGALAPTGGAAVTGGVAPVATYDAGLAAGTVAPSVAPASTVLPEVSANGIAGGGAFTPATSSLGTPLTSFGVDSAAQYSAYPQAVGDALTKAAATPSFWDSSMGTAAKWGAGLLGASAILGGDKKKYGTYTQNQVTTNPLPYTSNYGTYQPLDTSVMRPMGAPAGYTGTPYGSPGYTGSKVGYAAGGIADANPMQNPSVGSVEQMSRDNALGQNQMFPQANINSPAFASATNTPMGSNMIAAAGDTNVDPYTGAERFAGGGIAGHSNLGGYAAGGNPRLLKGPGDGMSDNIPATIGGHQPARLADGEFVVPADVVSHLGNGSTDAGANKLHSMMDKVRKARTGTKKQGKQIKADKFVPK